MSHPDKPNPDPEASASVPRRTFLASAAAVTAGFTIVPRHVLGGQATPAPSDKLNIACVGVGGMGKTNVGNCETENIVALCDVDFTLSEPVFAQYPNAKRYKDYRVMLDEQKDIDAVIIATPDHSHAVIAMAAMERKKHVYVQKPLTHSVYEARLLTETARKHGVATQMGNQGHSGEGARILCEWVWDGAIGKIREAHAWTNRPVWPSGIEVDRPTETPEVPPGLDWDLWLGPARSRPYHPTYHPAKWRAWWDFGTGSLGDMGCHIVDPLFWALKLKYPVAVEANISKYWQAFFEQTLPKNEMFPRSTIVRFRFPAREKMPEVDVTWWDGGLMPPRPAGLEPGRRMGNEDGGILLIGEKGTIMAGCYGESPRLVPESAMKKYGSARPRPWSGSRRARTATSRTGSAPARGASPPAPTSSTPAPCRRRSSWATWPSASPTGSCCGTAPSMEVTNDEDANAYVRREYREGWHL